MKHTLLFILIFSFFSIQGFSQDMSIYGFYRESGTPPEDYVVLGEMDPLSGTFYDLDTINQIYAYALASSTFDQANQYYIFKGVDTGNVMKLISRDVTDNFTAFSPVNEITINDFQYDMNTQVIYALGNYIVDSILIDTLNGGTYMYEYASRLMAINTETGDEVELNQMPDLRAFPVGNSTFDSNSGRYIVCGIDASYNTRIFVIDVQTGAILSQTLVATGNGQNLNELEYNNEDNTLYGIFRDNSQSLMAIISVDIETGEINIMDEIEDGFAFTPGASVFDQMSQSFIFQYLDFNNQTRLLVYDVAEKVFISNISIDGFFTEIEVNNSAYAALKYGTTSIEDPWAGADALRVFPNPAVSEFSVYCEDQISNIKVYDLTGKEVYESNCNKTNHEIVASEEFNPGIYFVRVEAGDQVRTKKIVIE